MREEDRGRSKDHDSPDVLDEKTGKPVSREQLQNFFRHGTYHAPPSKK